MPHDEYATCPHCGKTAWGRNEIESLFGYRYEGTTPQSWCKDCRAIERRTGKNCSYTDCLWWGETDCSSNHDCPLSDD